MQDRVRVWAVDLVEGASTKERQGMLSLDEATLRFEPSKEVEPTLTIPLREVAKVKRLRGSPVIVVQFRKDDAARRTAFYFVQPPPLAVFLGERDERNVLTALRNPKRKARRENVGYLGMSNRAKKDELVAWERAIRAAADAARDS